MKVGDKVRIQGLVAGGNSSFYLGYSDTVVDNMLEFEGKEAFIDMIDEPGHKAKLKGHVGIAGWNFPIETLLPVEDRLTTKDTNPKDSVGIRKWRQFTTVPLTVVTEIGVAMLEGARKYGRHNYRVAGVRSSVYVDASIGHIAQWWEGEDTDPDSGLSHITKAIASLVVLRDAMIQEKLVDDRPPKAKLDKVRGNLQAVVDGLFDRHPNAAEAYTNES